MSSAAWRGTKRPATDCPIRISIPRTLEERLVPLIDSVVELDRPTTLDDRCASIGRRYHGNRQFLKRFEQAADIARSTLKTISEDFGFSLEQVAQQVLID